MNTVVRALPQERFATRKKAKSVAAKQTFLIVMLVCAVLLSAFAVVYIKDLYRRLFIDYQRLQDAQTQIYTDWGKLLLEQLPGQRRRVCR